MNIKEDGFHVPYGPVGPMHAQLGTSEGTLVASSTLGCGSRRLVGMLKQKARMLLQEWNDHVCNDLVADVALWLRAFAHCAMGHRIDPSWGGPIAHSSQCSMTGVTKAVVCATLSVGWCI